MLDHVSNPSSRLVKRECKKLLNQTIIFGGLAVVIIFGFIFVILPVFIRMLNAVFGPQTGFEPEDTLPPSPPTLSAPVAATFSAQLKLKGFAEPKSEVVFVLNGDKQSPVTASDDGSFESGILLTEGENSLTSYAVDDAGNESNTSKTYNIILDTEVPTLEITAPEEGAEIVSRANQDIKIEGKTEPKSKVFINERVVFPNADGIFSHTVHLNEGENKIKVKVVDQAGNSVEQELTVSFKL